MPKIEYNGIMYDSEEEVHFQMWVNEAMKHKIFSAQVYQPTSYPLIPKATIKEFKQLTTKVKTVERTLLRAHKYTPDWALYPGENWHLIEKLTGWYRSPDAGMYLIDVKGNFDRNKSIRIFSIDQKLLWNVHGVYVNKVVPKQFFPKTFVPWDCAWIKGRKKPTRCKPYADAKFIRQVIAV